MSRSGGRNTNIQKEGSNGVRTRVLRSIQIGKYPKWTIFNVVFGGAIVLAIVITVILAPLFTPYDPLQLSASMLAAPSQTHPFGTDTLGRDVASRCLYGGRVSLLVAFISVLLSSVLGMMTGTLSGYLSGAFDRGAVFVADILYAFPVYVMALVITVVLSPTAENMAIAISISYVPQYFRVGRSLALSLRERAFIDSERIIGAGTLYIVRRHIIPSVLPSIVIIASMGIADTLTVVAGLSFMGLGIQPPTPEWGLDLRVGREVFLSGMWWVIVFPGLMIFLAVLGFNLLGEGLTSVMRERRPR